MFIWDFVADTILEQIMDWVYKQIIGFLANFFAEMGNMGAEMFEMSWVQSIVLFFSYLAWILYAVGFVVACAKLCLLLQSVVFPVPMTRRQAKKISVIKK